MSRFTRALTVVPLADITGEGGRAPAHAWVLERDLVYEVGELGSGVEVICPRGSITDFASIPRPLWVIWPRWGLWGKAAVLHDRLYHTHETSRAEADCVFLEAMEVLGVKPFTRRCFWLAVRVFGIWAWHGGPKGYRFVPEPLLDAALEVPIGMTRATAVGP